MKNISPKQLDYIEYLQNQCVDWLKQTGIEWTPQPIKEFSLMTTQDANVMIDSYKNFNKRLEVNLEKSIKAYSTYGSRLKQHYTNFPCFWEKENS